MDYMPRTYGWRQVREKKSGKYEARWVDESGTLRARSFFEKAQAKKYADDMATAVGNAEVGLAVLNKSMADALKDFLERRLDPKTTALNERRMGEFLAAFPDKPAKPDISPLPALVRVNQLSDKYINRFDSILEARGCNPGGRQHVLKIVRAFCRYCRKKKWLHVDPFEDFKMPSSEFEGRALSEEEFERMGSIGWIGGNQHGDTKWSGTNQHPDVDLWLRRAFVFGRATMLRISQVWKLTPKDFRAPDQLWVEGIKGQPGVWAELHPTAVAVLNEIMALPGRGPEERFFSYWSSIASMQTAVNRKARRVGLPGIRFHDVCKVTRISELSRAGFAPAELEHLSNTTKRTLIEHYMKADRKKSFDRYKQFQSAGPDPRQTLSRPENTPNAGNVGLLAPKDATASTTQNSANSPSIPNL